MTDIHVRVDEKTLRQIIINYLSELLNTDISETDIKIEVKSKQNYKSEWEEASFQASIRKVI